MIPHYTTMLILLEQLQTLLRLRPIAYHISQTPYLVNSTPVLYIC
jgi:hypothetical protein